MESVGMILLWAERDAAVGIAIVGVVQCWRRQERSPSPLPVCCYSWCLLPSIVAERSCARVLGSVSAEDTAALREAAVSTRPLPSRLPNTFSSC